MKKKQLIFIDEFKSVSEEEREHNFKKIYEKINSQIG